MEKRIPWKDLIVSLLITLGAGALPNLFIQDSMEIYKTLRQPLLAPPAWLFPIVWTILYLLMGISLYLIYKEDSPFKKKAIVIYAIQLALNALWPLLFFKLQAYFLAFVWLVLLLVFIVYMILLFKKIRILAAWLQIPYLLWVIFAGYLNFSIWQLN